MKEYHLWERMTPRQREKSGQPDNMEIPKRRCHVVVDATIEALIMALRDNPHGVLMYKDEIDSLLSNFNRYNGSDESYFLSLFSGTAFKYSRKSNNEHVFLPNPYCSIIGSTQPGRLAEQFGGKRQLNGLSARFLKVYPEITEMPSWSERTMPNGILVEWERIIRKVVGFSNTPQLEGKRFSKELGFSSEARARLIDWKTNVNNREYSSSDSEGVKALCGKLETYIIRFALVIQIMRGVCGEAEMNEIDTETAERVVRLTEYSRAMENRIVPELSGEGLNSRYSVLLSSLENEFTTGDAVETGLFLGIPERSVKRFLSGDGRDFFDKTGHGKYRKK